MDQALSKGVWDHWRLEAQEAIAAVEGADFLYLKLTRPCTHIICNWE